MTDMLVNRFNTRAEINSSVSGWDEIVYDRDDECYYFIRHRNFGAARTSISYDDYDDAISAYWSGWCVWNPVG